MHVDDTTTCKSLIINTLINNLALGNEFDI